MCRAILALASVFGREFSLEAVGQMSGRPLGGVLDVLDDAIAARVVAEIPEAPGRCRFAHALIRDTLYDSIGAGRRLRLHQQAGQTLEALYQSRVEPHLAELAHHFFEAAPSGEAGKAMDYAERAGRAALGLLAYEEVVRLFRMALTALDLGRRIISDGVVVALLVGGAIIGSYRTRGAQCPMGIEPLIRSHRAHKGGTIGGDRSRSERLRAVPQARSRWCAPAWVRLAL